MRISIDDVNVLLDALAKASSRHESIARSSRLRPNGDAVRRHEDNACRMRRLRAELLRLKKQNAPMTLEVNDAV